MRTSNRIAACGLALERGLSSPMSHGEAPFFVILSRRADGPDDNGRELKRNGGQRRYRAAAADSHALVERHSRYVLLAKVPNGDSRSVITALIDQAHRYQASRTRVRLPPRPARTT